MTAHLQLDLVGGIAGDMFIAAMLHARPELAGGVLAAIRAAGLPPSAQLDLVDHADGVLAGKRFLVGDPAVVGSHDHHHPHTAHRDVVAQLRASHLDPPVRDRSLAIFALLAAAEAEVHGVAVDDVEFHEVGAWDSIADVVGAAWLLDRIAPASWAHGPLPLGSGRVRTAHGLLPVPAPATALLLRGFTFVDDGIAGERITPTGAAILQHLRLELGPPALAPPSTLTAIGVGFGTRRLPGISNVLRALLFETADAAVPDDHVALLEFEVDDQTAEDLAAGVDALRALPTVIDVLQAPAMGKKGRVVTQLRVLCAPASVDEVVRQCFVETTTLGVRRSLVQRTVLPRDVRSVDVGERRVRVKTARRPDGAHSAKADIDDLVGTGGHAGRERRRREAERQRVEDGTGDE